MDVEIYIGFAYSGGSSGGWVTDYVTVPERLREHPVLINDFIEGWIRKHPKEFEGMVFWGIYNILPLEEEDDGE